MQYCCGAASRRDVLGHVAAVSATTLIGTPAFAGTAPVAAPPSEVAGIALPQSALARKAAAYAASMCPDYLFNHCMRTYLFGALLAKKQKLSFDADAAFAAAALHDLGLLKAFESARQSFEIDGADAAEKFARDAGAPKASTDLIWHAVEMHDGKWPLTRRQGAEAMVVAIGAGSDVDGPDPHLASPAEIREIVTAFPRLQFKKQFTALLIDHCKRKPQSQAGTWLEGLCREQVPGAWTDTVEKEIAAAPFAE
jgi:hypothetical protein